RPKSLNSRFRLFKNECHTDELLFMSSLQAKLAEFENHFSGEFSFEKEDLDRHATDASIYYLKPQAIHYPKNSRDLLTALQFCQKYQIPLTCRGAGTSTAGQSIGEGLVIDFSRHMTKILALDVDSKRIEIEPGIV